MNATDVNENLKLESNDRYITKIHFILRYIIYLFGFVHRERNNSFAKDDDDV